MSHCDNTSCPEQLSRGSPNGQIKGCVLRHQPSARHSNNDRVGLLLMEASAGLGVLHGTPAEAVALVSALHVPGVCVLNITGCHPLDTIKLLRDVVAIGEFTAPPVFNQHQQQSQPLVSAVFPTHLVLLASRDHSSIFSCDASTGMKSGALSKRHHYGSGTSSRSNQHHLDKLLKQQIYNTFFGQDCESTWGCLGRAHFQKKSLSEAFLSVSVECVDAAAFHGGANQTTLNQFVRQVIAKASDVRFTVGDVGGGRATLTHLLDYSSRMEKRSRQVVSIGLLHQNEPEQQQNIKKTSISPAKFLLSPSSQSSPRDPCHGFNIKTSHDDSSLMMNVLKSPIITYFSGAELGCEKQDECALNAYNDWIYSIAVRTLEEDFRLWFASFGDENTHRLVQHTASASGDQSKERGHVPTVLEVEARFNLVVLRIRALLSALRSHRCDSENKNEDTQLVRVKGERLLKGAETLLAVAVSAVKRRAAAAERYRQQRQIDDECHEQAQYNGHEILITDRSAADESSQLSYAALFNTREIPPVLHSLAAQYPQYRFWLSYTGLKFIGIGLLVFISSLYLDFF